MEDQKLLDGLGWKKKLVDIDNAILANANFVQAIIAKPEIFSDAELAEDGEGVEDDDHHMEDGVGPGEL